LLTTFGSLLVTFGPLLVNFGLLIRESTGFPRAFTHFSHELAAIFHRRIITLCSFYPCKQTVC